MTATLRTYTAADLAAAKMLTVRQPWAWAIAVGAKTIENRTTCWNYRGPLLIHAGAAWSERGGTDPRIDQASRDHLGMRMAMPPTGSKGDPCSAFAFRSVVAVADLVDVHVDEDCCKPWGESSYTEVGGHTVTAVVHLVLADIVELPNPVPARGGLGLRPVADHVAAAVAEQTA